MAKDFARGERKMIQATPIKVDRENDTPRQGGSNTPSWQNRSYGYKALESDTIPPIPEHFKTGSWMNRFNAPQQGQIEPGQTEQGKTGQSTSDKADSKQQLIAFGNEATFLDDPLSGLIKIIVGGAIVGVGKTLQEAQKLWQQIMKSQDEALPKDKDGRPVPDSEYPHSQIGTKKGKKGKYRQTREWGKKGKLKKDIDWTDHGRPNDHPNPHEHQWIPNPTGGTPQRGSAEPLK